MAENAALVLPEAILWRTGRTLTLPSVIPNVITASRGPKAPRQATVLPTRQARGDNDFLDAPVNMVLDVLLDFRALVAKTHSFKFKHVARVNEPVVMTLTLSLQLNIVRIIQGRS